MSVMSLSDKDHVVCEIDLPSTLAKSAELNICRNQLAVVMVIINHISLFAFTGIKEE